MVLSYVLASFIGTITNSFFVLGALVISGAISFEIMFTVLFSNTLLEAAAAVIICVTVMVVKDSTVASRNKKSKLSKLDDNAESSNK